MMMMMMMMMITNLCLFELIEICSDGYSKRQTSDSSWEFLKIVSEHIKTVQNKMKTWSRLKIHVRLL